MPEKFGEKPAEGQPEEGAGVEEKPGETKELSPEEEFQETKKEADEKYIKRMGKLKEVTEEIAATFKVQGKDIEDILKGAGLESVGFESEETKKQFGIVMVDLRMKKGEIESQRDKTITIAEQKRRAAAAERIKEI